MSYNSEFTLSCQSFHMLFSGPLHHRGKKEFELNLPYCIYKAPHYNQVFGKYRESVESRRDRFVQPPPSVPSAAEQSPEATIAAGPEDDPPVYLSGSCGFLVVLLL